MLDYREPVSTRRTAPTVATVKPSAVKQFEAMLLPTEYGYPGTGAQSFGTALTSHPPWRADPGLSWFSFQTDSAMDVSWGRAGRFTTI